MHDLGVSPHKKIKKYIRVLSRRIDRVSRDQALRLACARTNDAINGIRDMTHCAPHLGLFFKRRVGSWNEILLSSLRLKLWLEGF